jgi:hypothetical protein
VNPFRDPIDYALAVARDPDSHPAVVFAALEVLANQVKRTPTADNLLTDLTVIAALFITFWAGITLGYNL